MRKHWMRQGTRWSYRVDPIRFPGSERSVAQYHTFDGTSGWQVSFGGEHATEIREITKCKGFVPWKKPVVAEPERLIGVTLSASQLSIEGLFEEPGVTVVGSEEVDGVPCIKIDFGVRPVERGRMTDARHDRLLVTTKSSPVAFVLTQPRPEA